LFQNKFILKIFYLIKISLKVFLCGGCSDNDYDNDIMVEPNIKCGDEDDNNVSDMMIIMLAV